MFSLGPVTGWLAFALVPLAALVAFVLRRYRRGRFTSRMRPHYAVGYAALALAVVHLTASMSGMGGANSTGIWMASAAILGLGWQALLGRDRKSVV